MTLLRRLSTATAAATLALVALGGLVRATGSGDACPQWPGCFPGRVLPPLETHALIEFGHRLAAGVALLLVVATAWTAWRRARGDSGILWPAVAAIGVVVVQSAIGAIRIEAGPKALIVTIHFLVAMALVAVVMMSATATRVPRRREGEGIDPGVRSLLRWSLVTTGALLLVGAYVRGEGAGLVFLDWPLMGERVIPDLTSAGTVASFLHRVLALVALILGGALAWRARRASHGGVRTLAWTAFGLLVAQAGLGAVAVLTRLAPAAAAGHVVGSSLAWASLVALGTTLRRLETASPRGPKTGARALVGALVQLMKPDIIVLLLITTVPAMVLAAGGMPPWGLVGATLLGGTLTAGGAGAINGYLDRDIDEVMVRTRRRPIPSHRIEPRRALAFGLALVVAGTVWLALTVNVLSAALSLAAAAFYVLVYTMWMKRSTPQNIVIGGAAGAAPALIGWAAVTGRVDTPAALLFAIVFAWTPPHFWALSLKHTDDYAAARVPMLPVVRGREETTRQILLYSVLLLALSLLLYPAARMGLLYLGAAVALGAVFVGYAVRVRRDGGTRAAMGLFHYSITYLGLLFAAVAADTLVRA